MTSNISTTASNLPCGYTIDSSGNTQLNSAAGNGSYTIASTGTSGTSGTLLGTTSGSINPYVTSGTMTGNVYAPPSHNNPWGSAPKPAVDLAVINDDEGRSVLKICLGEEKDCDHKVHIFPGIQLYSNHKKPGLFRRFMLGLIFGIKWESTLEEKFIEQL